MLFPPVTKGGTGLLQIAKQELKRVIVGIASVIRSKLGDQTLRLCLPVTVHHMFFPLKEAPDHITRVRGIRFLKVKEPFSRTIPGEDIPTSPDDKGWMRSQCVHDALEGRTNFFLLCLSLSMRGITCQQEEMSLLYRSEPECLSNAFQHGPRRIHILSLLQQCIPGDSDIRQFCYLFAS